MKVATITLTSLQYNHAYTNHDLGCLIPNSEIIYISERHLVNELLPKGVAESQSYEKPTFAVMKMTKIIQVAF